MFAESVWLQRGQSQTFLGSERRCNEGPRPQIAARGVQAGCGEAGVPLAQRAALGQVPGEAGGVSILGGFRETSETAHARGTSAIAHVRERKVYFEVKHERLLLKFLRLHARQK